MSINSFTNIRRTGNGSMSVIEQGEEKKEFYYIVGDDDRTEISVN